MSIFAIGDLHLSGIVEKPMDIFGSHWSNHWEKIKKDWNEKVTEEDAVLIPGDISWAMTLDEAIFDLQELERLPGHKFFVKGNHDYWWKSVTKLNELFKSQYFIQNNFYTHEEYLICGSRGWVCPNISHFTEHDKKLYERELKRLILSLRGTQKVRDKKIIVMTHFPPTNDQLEPSAFTELYEQWGVSQVIYGHLHGEHTRMGLEGDYNGVFYSLVSADYLDFQLKLIV
ncbi:MAG: serine/threonine protein phosphatase [Epulopiscium sp.]|nr:serine/threonine protein phosphatase [Candidatus Epulonipiscium sp.]